MLHLKISVHSRYQLLTSSWFSPVKFWYAAYIKDWCHNIKPLDGHKHTGLITSPLVVSQIQVLEPTRRQYSPVCILIWFLWLVALANFFPQSSQLYGFSPVCVLICTLRMFDVVNDRLQPSNGQRNGFSPAKTNITKYLKTYVGVKSMV